MSQLFQFRVRNTWKANVKVEALLYHHNAAIERARRGATFRPVSILVADALLTAKLGAHARLETMRAQVDAIEVCAGF